MYYYILEAPSSRAIRAVYQKLRDSLTNAGIAGEIIGSNPARTPSELAQMGITKGFSTIVAVGGDRHVDEVASAVIGRATLGIIPIDATAAVTDIIGCSNMKDAIDNLKTRRVSLQSVVVAEPQTIIFLDSYIFSTNLSKASLVIDNKYKAHSYFNQIRINRFLEVELMSEHQVEVKKVFGFFKTGGNVVRSNSRFHGTNIKIITDPELPLISGTRELTTTPLNLRLVPESLKVITRRGTIYE